MLRNAYIDRYICDFLNQKLGQYFWLENIIEKLDESSVVGIYGAGEHTLNLIKYTEILNKHINYIFDRSAKNLGDICVCVPTMDLVNECDVIILSSIAHATSMKNDLINKYHFKGQILKLYKERDTLPFYEYYPQHCKEGSARRNRYNKMHISREEADLLREACGIIKRILDENRDTIVTDVDYLPRFDWVVEGMRNVCDDEKVSNIRILITQGYKTDEHRALIPIKPFMNAYDRAFDAIKNNINKIHMIVETFCSWTEENTYLSMDYKLFNQRHEDYLLYNTEIQNYEDIAIVIQGPIKERMDYTYESIQQYMVMFPGIKIVFSTWADERGKPTFSRITRIDNVLVVTDEKPVYRGLCNVNMQIWTTANGIEKVKKVYPNVKYVLKIRSDARIYARDILKIMKLIVDQRQTRCEKACFSRIVCSTSSRDVRYYYSDFYNFGTINDMDQFWKKEIMDETIVTELDEFIKDAPEILLYYRYARNRGIREAKVDERDLYAFVPYQWLDMEWNKYYNLQKSDVRNSLIAGDKNPTGGKIFGMLDIAKWNFWI